jgi:hypothetical protein
MVGMMNYTCLVSNASDPPDLMKRLVQVFSSIPNDIFYSDGKLLLDGCKAFNGNLTAELVREFGRSLKSTNTHNLRGFYSYPVEYLVAHFRANENSECACIFLPDSDSGQLPSDDLTPWNYVFFKDIFDLPNTLLDIAGLTSLYMVGYFYPYSLTRYGIDVSYV